jgi:hypothetical protein
MKRLYFFLLSFGFFVGGGMGMAQEAEQAAPPVVQDASSIPMDALRGLPDFWIPEGRPDSPPKERSGPPPWERGEDRMRPPRKDEKDWLAKMQEYMNELRKENPELAEVLEKLGRLRMEMVKNLKEYHQTDDALIKAEREKKINLLAAEEFDLELQRQTLEIKRMEKDLTSLKNAVKLREQYREPIIRSHVQKLLTPPKDDNPFFRGPKDRQELFDRMKRHHDPVSSQPDNK